MNLDLTRLPAEGGCSRFWAVQTPGDERCYFKSELRNAEIRIARKVASSDSSVCAEGVCHRADRCCLLAPCIPGGHTHPLSDNPWVCWARSQAPSLLILTQML